jgi:hypothetical protein
LVSCGFHLYFSSPPDLLGKALLLLGALILA